MNAPTGGPSDAAEWVPVGTKDTNELAKPPAGTPETDCTISFTRAKASKTPPTAVGIEAGTTLDTWPLSSEVGTAPEITVPSIDDHWELGSLSIPRSPDTRKFARLFVGIE